ncbi:L,D-transpeptidase family protein [Erythrobacter sp. WG]|uniref:L,D-transpeptidase family protein n=1 Tax=Erythrobacter sp. WG TaxID=2985510 RepID=UPI00226E6246|nr:L,D-transpeptidase family protein [Erythrobacter sp. WG]MCX9146209.1 L,D-transpeptidase family protein [Erythrobacter sp. WG]
MALSRIRDIVLLAAGLLLSACIPEVRGENALPIESAAQAETLPPVVAAELPPPPTPPLPDPPPPPPKLVGEVLDSGTVITISLASQRMDVFRDGALWRSSPVSTGRRGKRTPAGVFAILQKKTFHRSNLYSNAPMPFMQRLTWSGIAIHAGHLPGYPASHGCIRVPSAFARELFRVTNPASTAVIIVDAPLPSHKEALALARASEATVPIDPVLLRRSREALARKADETGEAGSRPAAARMIPAPEGVAAGGAQTAAATTPAPDAQGKGQTIQLAATLSPALAQAHWEAVAVRKPELKAMQMAIIPAVVNGTQYYRLRASAPGAHATCAALKRAGIACFPVS